MRKEFLGFPLLPFEDDRDRVIASDGDANDTRPEFAVGDDAAYGGPEAGRPEISGVMTPMDEGDASMEERPSSIVVARDDAPE